MCTGATNIYLNRYMNERGPIWLVRASRSRSWLRAADVVFVYEVMKHVMVLRASRDICFHICSHLVLDFAIDNFLRL